MCSTDYILVTKLEYIQISMKQAFGFVGFWIKGIVYYAILIGLEEFVKTLEHTATDRRSQNLQRT